MLIATGGCRCCSSWIVALAPAGGTFGEANSGGAAGFEINSIDGERLLLFFAFSAGLTLPFMALPFRNHFFSDSAPAARGFHEKANSTHNYTSMLHQSRILKQPCRSTRSARVIRASAAIQASYTYRQGSPQDVEFIKQRLWLES